MANSLKITKTLGECLTSEWKLFPVSKWQHVEQLNIVLGKGGQSFCKNENIDPFSLSVDFSNSGYKYNFLIPTITVVQLQETSADMNKK